MPAIVHYCPLFDLPLLSAIVRYCPLFDIPLLSAIARYSPLLPAIVRYCPLRRDGVSDVIAKVRRHETLRDLQNAVQHECAASIVFLAKRSHLLPIIFQSKQHSFQLAKEMLRMGIIDRALTTKRRANMRKRTPLKIVFRTKVDP